MHSLLLLAPFLLPPAPAFPSPYVQAVPRGQTPSFCFDTATRLPEKLPLATPRPADCSAPVVVDIASTVLQYGMEVRLEASGCAIGAVQGSTVQQQGGMGSPACSAGSNSDA